MKFRRHSLLTANELALYPLSLLEEAEMLKIKKLSLYDAFVIFKRGRKPVKFGHVLDHVFFSQSEVHLLNHPWHSNYYECHC